MKRLLPLFVVLLVPALVQAEYPTETEWATAHADDFDAQNEVRLWDRTRCDYVTDTHAIEIDWAKTGKWAEAVGQAMYYSIVLDKKPGIIMLVKDQNTDRKYVYRCQTVCAKLGIKLWVVKVEE